jgi:hypothetical protein
MNTNPKRQRGRPTQAACCLAYFESRGSSVLARASGCYRFSLFALCWAIVGAAGFADEIYSNASGGGDWSDPATWRGGKVPAAEDDVVIARDDSVTFDRDDSEKTTCKQLSLDPRAVLHFKVGAGPIVFCANGLVESYGYIRLDASKSAKDQHEFRLVAEDAEQRMLKIAKGGGLVVSGRLGLVQGRKNALVASRPPKKEVPAGMPQPDPTALLEAAIGSTLDIQRAELINMNVQPTGIDNTGAKPGERINLIKNRFSGTSRLMITSCDSAVVADNLFERDDPFAVPQAALYITACPLIEVRGNTIRGNYPGGITCYGQNECIMTNNVIEKCAQGLYWYGSGFMVKQLSIKDCAHGMTLTSAAGTLEDITIAGSQTAYYHGGATIQMTNLVIRDMVAHPNGYKIYMGTGPLTLINSPVRPDDITIPPSFVPAPLVAGKPRLPAVEMLNFLVVQVNGQVPPGSAVELKTAGLATPLPPGAQDPNIRNSPAAVLKSGFTPLPQSLEPLIVRSWQYDADAKLQPAPVYQLNIVGPVQAAGTERKLLKSLTCTPAAEWYRANPNEKKPTIEVSLP